MNDTKKPPLTEDVLLEASKSTLEDATAGLDEDVRRRLQQARRAAVDAFLDVSHQPSKPAIRPGWVVTAGGFAVLVLALSVVFYESRPLQDPSPVASIEDMPILSAPEELDLYEELDFYQWLAEEHDGVG